MCGHHRGRGRTAQQEIGEGVEIRGRTVNGGLTPRRRVPFGQPRRAAVRRSRARPEDVLLLRALQIGRIGPFRAPVPRVWPNIGRMGLSPLRRPMPRSSLPPFGHSAHKTASIAGSAVQGSFLRETRISAESSPASKRCATLAPVADTPPPQLQTEHAGRPDTPVASRVIRHERHSDE
jgi:hypothetical protein